MSGNSELGSQVLLTRVLFAAVFLCLLIKLYLGNVLDLYSDEVFYWLASTKPAIAYSDLPFMTALLAGLGGSLADGSALAVRLPFILMGSTLPFLVYWLALPISNRQQALESSVLSVCLPLGGFLGLLAVPDVPLIFFGLLSIGFFERALRLNEHKYWIFTGIAVALGLSTHYRFVLYPAAAFLFLCAFKPAWPQWRNSKLWIAVAIASVGLIPIAWFNLSHQLSSASFYFVDRHPWEFQSTGLLHLFKQAGLVTPPLYILLIYTAITLFKKAKVGDQSAALLFSFGSLNILVYLLLAPWSDATSTSIHWPLSGYYPLLVFLPQCFRLLLQQISTDFLSNWGRTIGIAVATFGFAGTLIAFVGIGSQAFQAKLQPLIGQGILSNKMAGWKEFSNSLEVLMLESDLSNQPILITDNYYTAAQAEFAGITDNAFTIDQDKAVRDGRITQFRLWGKDLSALAHSQSRNFIFVTEDSTLNVIETEAVIKTACSISQFLEWNQELELFQADKKFSFYTGQLAQTSDSPTGEAAFPCPYPSRAWIDTPIEEDIIAGVFQISGWAVAQDVGIESVTILIDNRTIVEAELGGNRRDVLDALPTQTSSDPNSPNLGFDAIVDSKNYSNGQHTLAIQLRSNSGATTLYGQRKISFQN